jgi:hypothetical protein
MINQEILKSIYFLNLVEFLFYFIISIYLFFFWGGELRSSVMHPATLAV